MPNILKVDLDVQRQRLQVVIRERKFWNQGHVGRPNQQENEGFVLGLSCVYISSYYTRAFVHQ